MNPWDVGTALRRLDRMLLVLPPDRSSREAILSNHLRERPVVNLDLGWISARTAGFSGAVGAPLRNRDQSRTRTVDRNREGPAISMGHLRGAAPEVRPSTTAWLQVAKNYAFFPGEGDLSSLRLSLSWPRPRPARSTTPLRRTSYGPRLGATAG